MLFSEGKGVKQDLNKAFAYWLKAGELGCITGSTKNYSKANSYLQKAANSGHSRGFYLLGEQYQRGLSVQQNNNKAIEYYKKAADLGSDEAKNKLKQMGIK